MVACLRSNAQNDNDIGSWNALVLKWTINEKFKFFSEAQLRSYSYYNRFYYYDWKTSITYSFTKWFGFATGLAVYNNYQTTGNFVKPSTLKEFRIYEEVAFKYSFSRFNFINRYRVDERFTTIGYRTRFRPRLGLILPVNHQKLIPKTFFLSLYDEMFISDKFEKNRYFLGVGYKFGTVSVLTGLVHDNNITSKEIKNYHLISLTFDLANQEYEAF